MAIAFNHRLLSSNNNNLLSGKLVSPSLKDSSGSSLANPENQLRAAINSQRPWVTCISMHRVAGRKSQQSARESEGERYEWWHVTKRGYLLIRGSEDGRRRQQGLGG